MKKAILLLLICLLATNIFAVSFTDSLGRVVELPKELDRIVPSGNLAQLVLYSVAPERIVGWSSRISETAAKYFEQDIVNLPVFGTFYGKKANLNKEALMSAAPDVVIDMGEIKGTKEEMAKELDDLQHDVMIPVIFIEAYLDNTPDVFRTLGKLLDEEEKCEELAVFAEEALNMAEEARKAITEQVTVYYSSSDDGLDAIAEGNFHGEVIEKVGAKNVVPSTFGSSSNKVSMEQLYIWDPDVIILTSPEAYKKATTGNEWKSLSAVKNGKVYLMPSEPYPFLDNPPATNRIIGIYWLGNLLYPDLYPVDIVEKTIEFYSLYYNNNLSASYVEKILNPSI